MNRRFQFQWVLIFAGVFVIGPIGCRLDNSRVADLDVEKGNTGKSSGGGGEDAQAADKNVAKGDSGSSALSGREGDRWSESIPERGNAGVNGSASITPSTVTGTVLDLLTDEPINGIRVVALNNADLSELGIEATTQVEGRFALEGIIGEEICVKLMGTEGEDARIDACNCNIPAGQHDREFVSTPLAVANAINYALFPCEQVCTGTTVSGGVYFRNDAGEEIPIACATVEIEQPGPDTEVIYFKNGFPDRSQVSGTDVSGRFLIVRIPHGRIQLSAFVNGEKIDSVSVPVCEPPDSTGSEFVNNIVRIHTDKSVDHLLNCELR